MLGWIGLSENFFFFLDKLKILVELMIGATGIEFIAQINLTLVYGSSRVWL